MLYSEKLSILERTFSQVKDYAEKFPPELVKKKPDEKAFSANEIIYHLLEVEELWQRRIHLLLHETYPHFQQIDPDALAKAGAYNEKPFAEGISLWKASREETIDLIEAMSEDQKTKTGVHSRYGEMNIYRIVDIMADHDLQHLRQLERTLNSMKK